jgi:hypothetical protein
MKKPHDLQIRNWSTEFCNKQQQSHVVYIPASVVKTFKGRSVNQYTPTLGQSKQTALTEMQRCIHVQVRVNEAVSTLRPYIGCGRLRHSGVALQQATYARAMSLFIIQMKCFSAYLMVLVSVHPATLSSVLDSCLASLQIILLAMRRARSAS